MRAVFVDVWNSVSSSFLTGSRFLNQHRVKLFTFSDFETYIRMHNVLKRIKQHTHRLNVLCNVLNSIHVLYFNNFSIPNILICIMELFHSRHFCHNIVVNISGGQKTINTLLSNFFNTFQFVSKKTCNDGNLPGVTFSQHEQYQKPEDKSSYLEFIHCYFIILFLIVTCHNFVCE